jgi:phage terminase large subunit GpA-like protein
MSPALRKLLRAVRKHWAPPPRLLPSAWAEANREMPDGSVRPGRFRFGLTPFLRAIVNATQDRKIRRIVCRKSAQIGWTDGVIGNLVGYRIAQNPSRMLILFPREKTAIDFNDEKLEPMIEHSPALKSLVNLTSRKAGNRQLFKKYPGGFLKLIASNAPGDVKSTSAPLIVVEEPDDCNLNVRGHGDSIKMAEERAKAYHHALIVIGGTPTERGNSAIDAEMEKTDIRLFYVPCHHCNESSPLVWENLRWHKDEAKPHSVWGKHHPETAHYVCPSCGGCWDDDERLDNISRGTWIATRPFNGAAGFDGLNELYSPFPGAMMGKVVEKYLDAQKAFEAGRPEKMITFYNSSLGKSYEYVSDVPAQSELEERGESYSEGTVPAAGIALVMGVDVQGNRLAIEVRAYGRDMESWLVLWTEEFGAPADRNDGVWKALDSFVDREYPRESGGTMTIEAVSIDSSDGQTNDAVYAWVRERRRAPVKAMAIKGRSGAAEIFSLPASSIDARSDSKASKYGLRVYAVGTEKAKDLILGYTADGGRIKQCDRLPDGSVRTGRGAGRMHWYGSVRPDYLEQLADSEVKIPGSNGRRMWTLKSGRRNEGLDTCVYAEHAARSLRLHLANDAVWAARERYLGKHHATDDAKPAMPPLRVSSGFPILSAKVN